MNKDSDKSLFAFDETIRTEDIKILAGADEAGRGPWAGPVVAAAVILPRYTNLNESRTYSQNNQTEKNDLFPSSILDMDSNILTELNDSKKLSSKKRELLYNEIIKHALAHSITIVDEKIIDNINILEATKKAVYQCVERLSKRADILLVDGNMEIKGISISQQSIIAGDSKSACIAAASILAKVTRDRIMHVFDSEYPQYGFAKHKGYGTAYHHEMLKKYGPCSIHRKSFAPVRKVLENRVMFD